MKCPRCFTELNAATLWCPECECDLYGNPNNRELQLINQVVEEISTAFHGVEIEDGVTIHEANQEGVFASECEREHIRALDGEGDWKDIPDYKIETLFSSLFYLDLKGWRFYLPAFMRWVARSWRGSSSPTPDWLLSNLTRKDGVQDFFESLNMCQSKAVLSFLRYCQLYLDEDAASDAIRSYWSRFSSTHKK